MTKGPNEAASAEGRRRGMQAQKTVLANGLRVLTERLDHVDSVSLGVWVTTGSKDEPRGSEGLTHLLEHMLFKGTETRSTRQIAEAIDDVGGHVNGFTDRECVYLFARTIGERTETALGLLFDLLLQSVFAEDDLRREKQVVVQEIGHAEDSPEGWVHELLPQVAWPDHGLGRPLMGSRESVAAFSRDSLLGHREELCAADHLVVAAAGAVEHDRVVELASRLGGELNPGRPRAEEAPPVFHSERRLISRASAQVHFCLATPGCARRDEARHALAVLDTILGGGSSSRLFQEIRENRGLAYGIGSYLQSYRDAGLLIIDGGTGPENFELVLELIAREVDRLRAEGPSPGELERAKTQLKVAVALAAESTSFRMQHLAASEIVWGRVLPFDEIIAGLERVTAEDVHELAAAAFAEGRQALVAIGPLDSAEAQTTHD